MSIRLLLADDHAIVRQGLRVLLEGQGFTVVGEAADGHEAVRRAQETQPDVALLDYVMPLLNGLEAAREIHKVSPRTQAILLTTNISDAHLLEALRSGVRGCVLKSHRAEDLAEAIRNVVRGGVYLSPGASRTIVDAYRSHSDLPADPLTGRERQVLQLIAEGKKTREAAEILCLSVKTIDSHRARIMQKLGIRDTAGLVRYAIQRGLSAL